MFVHCHRFCIQKLARQVYFSHRRRSVFLIICQRACQSSFATTNERKDISDESSGIRPNFYFNAPSFGDDDHSQAAYNEPLDKFEGKLHSHRRNWEISLYNRFKDLVDTNVRNIYPPIVFKMLKGVLDENQEEEFMKKYFQRWWNALVQLNVPPVTLCRNVKMLGEINIRTNGVFRRYYLREFHLSQLEKLFLSFEFNEFEQSYFFSLFFEGFVNLTSPSNLEYRRYEINRRVLSRSFGLLDNVLQADYESIKIGQTFATVLECSAKMRLTLNRDELLLILNCYKIIFNHERLLHFDSAVDIFRNLVMLNQFANAFCTWRLNPDCYWKEIWFTWFTVSADIIKLIFDKEIHWFIYKTLSFDGNEVFYCKHPNSSKKLYRAAFSTQMIEWCKFAAIIASNFDQFDELLKIRQTIWLKILPRELDLVTPFVAKEFYDAASSAELILKAKLALVPSVASEINLVDKNTIAIVAMKLKMLRKREIKNLPIKEDNKKYEKERQSNDEEQFVENNSSIEENNLTSDNKLDKKNSSEYNPDYVDVTSTKANTEQTSPSTVKRVPVDDYLIDFMKDWNDKIQAKNSSLEINDLILERFYDKKVVSDKSMNASTERTSHSTAIRVSEEENLLDFMKNWKDSIKED